MTPLLAWIKKRFFSTDLAITLTVHLTFMIIGFIVVYFCHFKSYYGYAGVVLFTLSLIGSHYIDEYANKAKLTGRILRPLQDIGFKIEHHADYWSAGSDYWGLLGTYRGYPIRIKYDRTGGQNAVSEIYFTLYFSTDDKAGIDLITDKIIKSRWGFHTYDYRVTKINSLIRTDRFLFIWTYDGIIKRLDALVEVALEGNLLPIEENAIPDLPKFSTW
jgi:hypothetical protein